jgi:serine protease Do
VKVLPPRAVFDLVVLIHFLHMHLRTIVLSSLAVSSLAWAETVKDREGAVRGDKAAMENDARWIYNDVDRGFAEAKKTGKPLLVVLRCIPCLSCMGIDASVLTEPALSPLLDRFVCVRVINTNSLDLSRFQFDYDLSFSTLIFNADGTIYGRYGSWLHQKNPQEKTTASYQNALNAALAIHEGYPGNKASLAGKQGGATPFKTPVEIPTLAGKYSANLDWDGKVVQSCVHCHQIGDAFRASYRDKGQPVPMQWIYPQPMPETVGITFAADRVAKIEAVASDSPAAKAGLQVGDELITFAGEPLISSADVSWALHRAEDSGWVAFTAKQGAGIKNGRIELPQGWRAKSDISKRVGTWPMRGMASGGMVLEDLSDELRAERGLGKDVLALFVKSVGQYGKHAAAKNAGFQKGDIVVALGEHSQRISEGAWIGIALQQHRAGEKLKASVLRGSERVELTLPMQ